MIQLLPFGVELIRWLALIFGLVFGKAKVESFDLGDEDMLRRCCVI